MHKCTSCGKSIATIHVLDLEGGSVVHNHYLCDSCAEAKGVVQSKGHNPLQHDPLQLSTEILENLLGGMKDQDQEGEDHPFPELQASELQSPENLATDQSHREGPVCPGCHLTSTEFRLRGRLGCPRCYEVFRNSLLPLLERVHDSTSHRGRFPGRSAKAPQPAVNLSELRLRLSRAIEKERYEEAAALRDAIRKAQDALNSD